MASKMYTSPISEASDIIPIIPIIDPPSDCTGTCTAMLKGAQWLSGRVIDSRPKGRRFEPHRRHCVVVLEQDKFILA